MFLTAEELEQLTGYRPCQRARMIRWLTKQGIPHTVNKLGNPVVLRSDIESGNHGSATPNLDWLKSA